MKKYIYITCLFTISILSVILYAEAPVSSKHEFKNTSGDVMFDIERNRSEVILHFQSAFFNDLEQITVERSGEGSGGFNSCKVLNLAELKITDGYFKTSDRFPLPASRDSYYRIKTVAKDGVTKTFPPIKLAALVD